MSTARKVISSQVKALSTISAQMATLKNACNLIVVDANEAVGLFNLSKKSNADFLRLESNIARRCIKIDGVRQKIISFEQSLANAESVLWELDVPLADSEARRISSDVLNGIQHGLSELNDWSATLDSAQDQMQLCVAKATLEVKG